MVAVNLVDLSPELRDAVVRVRDAASRTGSLRPPRVGPFESPLTVDERRAVAELIEDGTVPAAIAAVAADDPDLANR